MISKKVISIGGVELKRVEKIGPRGGRYFLYQWIGDSSVWGYWYDTAKQAIESKNGFDRVVV